ncbi:MAG: tetratricopeptide repeat protein [Roseiflexaceae bacterium]|nr:tetratricopeptide repeat protein [Roseiflexaceae bacterium]
MLDSNTPRLFTRDQLRRFLAPDLAEAVGDSGRAMRNSAATLEAFIHLAAAHYTITTYLPRLLTQHILQSRPSNPWLTWTHGSLLFADLSGSTALAEQLATLGREGTERLTDALNQIFGTMIGVVEQFDGDLIAFGGDALLVLFAGAQHQRTAAQAALALQDALHNYTHAIPGADSFPMHLHIGVESGRIGFASAGLEHARHCCVLGSAVNRVATAETLAGVGKIVIGPQLAHALGGTLHGEEVSPGFIELASLTSNFTTPTAHTSAPPQIAAPADAIPQLLADLSLISPYVPPLLLEKILAAPQQPQVEAELRPVTVLFAQCVGIERLAERLPNEQAAQVLQAYVAEMQQAVERFGGVVNKLDIADEGMKLIAIFGAPTAYEDHAERATLAAMEMNARIADCRLQIAEIEQAAIGTLQPVIQQRIGLNLGTVFAGNVGSAARKEYTVMGDAVNVAARVMGKAGWGEIWCSAAVAHAAAAQLVCEDRGEVALRGKAQPLVLLRISARREAASAEPPAATGPLIGRERELALLREHLAAAKAGQGCAVRIMGDAGVGKSRLTATLIDDARAAGFQIIAASCFSYTAGIPYAAWGEWLKARCGIIAGDANAERIRKLTDALAQLGPDMSEWLPILGDLARLDIADNRLTRSLDPKMRQSRRFELLEQLLFGAAESSPVLVLFEDLHWADPISLDLWQRVVGSIATKRVLLVGVHRPGLALAEQAHSHLLRLHELSAEESSAMIGVLVGTAALPEPLLRQIVARAGGNPLFLRELIYAVTEHAPGVKVQHETAQHAINDLPDSLNGLLLARIDRLDETSRSVLRIASVIGQRIPFGVLRSLQPQEQDSLVRQLLRLDEHELTQMERAEPERVHVFRHALIQEVAYQSMLYARRRELHGRIGAYLERRYAGDLDDYVGLIAHHYRLSDRREQAVAFLLRAGEAACSVYANEEAIQSYRWALEKLEDNGDPRTWQARDALADVLATIGRYDEARAQHSTILNAPGVSADAAQRAHRKRGAVHEKQGQYAAALEDLERAMAIAASGQAGISPLAVPAVCADVALVHQRRGEYDQAIAACEQGLARLDRDPKTREDEQLEARLHLTIGTVYGMRGDYPRARNHFEHSLKIREMLDDLPGLAGVHNNLGYLWQLEDEYEKAFEQYTFAEAIARRVGLPFMLIFTIGNAAYTQICLSDYVEAEQKSKEVLELATTLNLQHSIAQAHNMLGLIYRYRGLFDMAEYEYQKALEIHDQLGSQPQSASTFINIATLHRDYNNLEQAAYFANLARNLAQDLRLSRTLTEALSVLVDLSIDRGEFNHAEHYFQELSAAAAHDMSRVVQGVVLRTESRLQRRAQEHLLRQSLNFFEAAKNRYEVAATQVLLGEVLFNSNHMDEGYSLLKSAEDTFSILNCKRALQKVQSLIQGEAYLCHSKRLSESSDER